MKKLFAGILISGALVSLYGCQATQTKTAAAAPELNNDDLYEVVHEGRYYVFDDFDVYQEFLTVGETSYRKVFIGGGPHGETLVHGLRGKDKKKLSGIAGVEMFKGTLQAADDFYGEIRAEDGRLYVFDSLEDMKAMRQVGEAPYRYTVIGAGPQQQTVVYVLNSSNKKKKPTALMAKFKAHNKI
ncbi:hypothetical protein [Neptunomonas sp. XY-337]|uniref:hypothetical protein n=1 Tax=Neptunomonas sp. XY-337 TaxID=2561897 RepID=UPI0010AAE329|nr:hypothetical protein [Neptunomonas sp. XY-337]